MKQRSDDESPLAGGEAQGVSRRGVLIALGAIVGARLAPDVASAAESAQVLPGAAEQLVSLTPAEAQVLRAIVARIIPADEHGPGALEARADRFIDRALSGALKGERLAYSAGLAAVNAYTLSSRGMSFTDLTAAEQDAVLSELERDHATGFTGSSSQFFELVRTHTIQGTFADPAYGGNANFIGWDLIGYPGARVQVTANLQRMDVSPEASRKSAYDYAMFTRTRD